MDEREDAYQRGRESGIMDEREAAVKAGVYREGRYLTPAEFLTQGAAEDYERLRAAVTEALNLPGQPETNSPARDILLDALRTTGGR